MKTNTFQNILLGEKLQEKSQKEKIITSSGIGYIRVSSVGQIKEGNGLDSQRRACSDYAKRIEVPIKQFFADEAISGKRLERDGISQAIEYIKQRQNTANPITHLFTTECSRISRSKNLYDTLDLEREIQKYGAKIVFVNMTALNNEDSGSQLLKTVSYYSAAQESERISERTITGMKNRVLEGFRPFARPLGYKSARRILPSGKEEVFMERDEPIASILAEGLEKFASGELFTKIQLFNFLKENGVNTKSGEKNGKALIDGITEKILDSQRLIVYAGFVLCPIRNINELIPGKHEPLISLETARAIAIRLSGKDNKPVAIRKDFNEYVPLRGIVYCSACGMKLTGGQSKGHLGKYYSYYQCCTRGCSEKSRTIKAEKVHSDIRDALFQRRSDEHIDKLFTYIFNEVLQSNYSTNTTHYKQKEQEIIRIEKEIEDIMDKIMTLTNQEVLKKLEDKIEILNKRKSLLEEEMKTKEEQTFDFIGLQEETQFLFRNADKIRDIADLELKYILVGVRYSGKIVYKKNQGVLNSDFSLSTAVYDLLISHNKQWGGGRDSNSRHPASQASALTNGATAAIYSSKDIFTDFLLNFKNKSEKHSTYISIDFYLKIVILFYTNCNLVFMIKNISRLTFIGGCILLLAGLMSDCSLPSKKIEQVYSFKEKVSLSNEQISHFEKMHNGVSFSEALNPFGPDGLEKHLYEGGFDKFYSQLQTEINKFQNNKLDRHKTKLRFWGGDVILFDSNDLMSFFIVNPEPRSIELNVHYLGSKVDLKNTLRVALINEAVNLLFFNEFPLSRERFIQEEMLSDLAMCMCPDSSNEKWMELVAGRLMPIVETPQFKQLDDITLIDRTGLNVPGYVKVIRIYANELIKSLQQSAEEITKKQGTITFLILQKYPNDEESFQKDMISFWKSELTPMKFQKFKSGCQNRYQEELRKYW